MELKINPRTFKKGVPTPTSLYILISVRPWLLRVTCLSALPIIFIKIIEDPFRISRSFPYTLNIYNHVLRENLAVSCLDCFQQGTSSDL